MQPALLSPRRTGTGGAGNNLWTSLHRRRRLLPAGQRRAPNVRSAAPGPAVARHRTGLPRSHPARWTALRRTFHRVRHLSRCAKAALDASPEVLPTPAYPQASRRVELGRERSRLTETQQPRPFTRHSNRRQHGREQGRPGHRQGVWGTKGLAAIDAVGASIKIRPAIRL
jgi:hypothetical protein